MARGSVSELGDDLGKHRGPAWGSLASLGLIVTGVIILLFNQCSPGAYKPPIEATAAADPSISIRQGMVDRVAHDYAYETGLSDADAARQVVEDARVESKCDVIGTSFGVPKGFKEHAATSVGEMTRDLDEKHGRVAATGVAFVRPETRQRSTLNPVKFPEASKYARWVMAVAWLLNCESA